MSTKALVNAAEHSARRGISKKQWVLNIFYGNFPLICLIIITIVFGILTKGNLFSKFNMKSMFSAAFPYFVGGLGSIYLYAMGQADLSMASSVSLAAILGAHMFNINLGLGIFTTILVGVVIGAIMGLIYAFVSIPTFIQGLAMNFLLAGILWPLQFGQSAIRVPKKVTAIDGIVFEVTVVLVLLIVTVLAYNHTKFGRECRMVGAGEMSAYQSGVNVKKVKFLAFTISGLTCGLAALFALVRSGAGSQTSGTGLNFNIMVSMILGGCFMGGGEGCKIRNAIYGGALLTVLVTGLSLVGFSVRYQEIAKGILFVVMIVVTTKFNNKIQK